MPDIDHEQQISDLKAQVSDLTQQLQDALTSRDDERRGREELVTKKRKHTQQIEALQAQLNALTEGQQQPTLATPPTHPATQHHNEQQQPAIDYRQKLENQKLAELQAKIEKMEAENEATKRQYEQQQIENELINRLASSGKWHNPNAVLVQLQHGEGIEFKRQGNDIFGVKNDEPISLEQLEKQLLEKHAYLAKPPAPGLGMPPNGVSGDRKRNSKEPVTLEQIHADAALKAEILSEPDGIGTIEAARKKRFPNIPFPKEEYQ